MKFLVLGCNGMAGHMISVYLKERGHNVIGFDRLKSKYVESICGDAFDTNSLRNIIEIGGYDTVINCIGLLNKDAEENISKAVFLNSYLPHFLVDITKNLKTQVIQMSTDCVFSGEKGKYTERDIPDGESYYDRTKALGEIIDSTNLTLRNSIVGPDINPKGIGLLNWFLTRDSEEVNGFTGAIWTGQTTLQLAKTMEAASLLGASGLINAVPNKPISKYELLCLFNQYFFDNKKKINKVEGVKVDKSLVRTNFEFPYIIPSYEQMIIELKEWIINHKEMYPHYKIQEVEK